MILFYNSKLTHGQLWNSVIWQSTNATEIQVLPLQIISWQPCPYTLPSAACYFCFRLEMQQWSTPQRISLHCLHAPGLYPAARSPGQLESSVSHSQLRLQSINTTTTSLTIQSQKVSLWNTKSRWTFKLLTKIRNSFSTATLQWGGCGFWLKDHLMNQVQVYLSGKPFCSLFHGS